jgi:hypothetical protein
MTVKKYKQLKKWIELWRQTGAELETIRIKEIRKADTQKAIESLNSSFKSAVKYHPPKPYSGLVDQQRYFRKLPV